MLKKKENPSKYPRIKGNQAKRQLELGRLTTLGEFEEEKSWGETQVHFVLCRELSIVCGNIDGKVF
jgi:hypothetical protein